MAFQDSRAADININLTMRWRSRTAQAAGAGSARLLTMTRASRRAASIPRAFVAIPSLAASRRRLRARRVVVVRVAQIHEIHTFEGTFVLPY
jgi:hypothetical protein